MRALPWPSPRRESPGSLREVLVGWSLFSCTRHRSSLNFSIVEPRVRNRRNSRESFSSSLPRAPAVHTPMCAFFPRTGMLARRRTSKPPTFRPFEESLPGASVSYLGPEKEAFSKIEPAFAAFCSPLRLSHSPRSRNRKVIPGQLLTPKWVDCDSSPSTATIE